MMKLLPFFSESGDEGPSDRDDRQDQHCGAGPSGNELDGRLGTLMGAREHGLRVSRPCAAGNGIVARLLKLADMGLAVRGLG